MEFTYKLIAANGLSPEHIEGTDKDGLVWFIPMDETNADYQKYLDKDAPKS
jgi:hypothetical protein